MKVLVINSSPRTDYTSTTKNMLAPFVKGLRDGGADVDAFNLSEIKIANCISCMSCMTNSAGKCRINDDMTKQIYPLFLNADYMVLATPIYFGTLNALMKTFIDRLFPFLENHQGIDSEGLLKQNYKNAFPKTIIVSSASWHGSHAFNQLSSYVQYLFKDSLIAELYRGNESSFNLGHKYRECKKKICGAIYLGGKKLAETGELPSDLCRTVGEDFDTLENLAIFNNLCIDSCIDMNVNVNEWLEKGTVLKLSSLEHFTNYLRLFYQEGVCVEEFSMSYDFYGRVLGNVYVSVGKDKLEIDINSTRAADIAIKVPFEHWASVLSGECSILHLVNQGLVEITGNFELLKEFEKVFAPSDPKKEG